MFNKKEVAYALSGGAACGFAHIGALKYLESMSIYPSAICGTSIGALIGGLYAFGMNSNEIEDVAKELNFIKIMDLFTTPGILKGGLIDTQKIRDFLYNYVGDVHISELKIPFVAVSCDAETGQEYDMYDAPLIDAMLASMSIPAVFVPYQYNGRYLIDGCVVNNFPMDLANHFSKHVIGINVVPLLSEANVNINGEKKALVRNIKKSRKHFPKNIENKIDVEHPQNEKVKYSKIEQIKDAIDTYIENRAIEKDIFTPFYTLSKTSEVLYQNQYNLIKKKKSNLIINMQQLKNYSQSDFHKAEEIIEIGYNSMKGYTYILQKFV